MKNSSFKKWDKFFMEHLETSRRKTVPPEILKNFGWEVEMKIRQEQINPAKPGMMRMLSPVWMPICTVAILFLVLAPHFQSGFHRARFVNTAEIPTEIAAMREVGVWTEEDENMVGGAENTLSEIEMFQKPLNH